MVASTSLITLQQYFRADQTMSFLLIAGKIIATVFLVAFLIAGVLKANPRTHNPEYRRLAEYSAGFLICTFSIFGIYSLWS
jgi:hypothetical protein